MQLVRDPSRFDVIVTTNLFGDILSDLTAGLVGGLGLVAGANIGESAAIFEAVHGTAPDIAGKGIANPTAVMLAGAMLLDHMGQRDRAQRLEAAIRRAIAEGKDLTPDVGGSGTTRTYTDRVIAALATG
jgi:isocitrate dehydrogenase (NAD+)